MKTRTIKSDLLMLLAAFIWGTAFVAQRTGMKYVGPFTFNTVRFALGAFVLTPLLFYLNSKNKSASDFAIKRKKLIVSGLLAGSVIFLGITFQQLGLLYTTAGKAGFITGLYVIIVPIIGILLRKKSSKGSWIGAILALSGLYFLSIKQRFTMERGDALELLGAFFWAAHVHLIDSFVNDLDPFNLAFAQFTTTSLFSLIMALIFEKIEVNQILNASLPILYAGVLSSGIAYTLQVVAQKEAHPTHAAIILSLEAVFAVLGGWLILKEILSSREIIGCLLMLAGMIISQLYFKHKTTDKDIS